MADGFLGRWAKRKEAVRQGKEVPAEPPREPSPQPSPASGRGSEAGVAAAAAPAVKPEIPPPPTLEDVATLTKDSDFSRFVRPDVAPDVKNAAMKKLFSDPHFNVMDGLDTYIDDYGKPDPIPPEMLRQLASAKFLNLFREEEEAEAKAAAEAEARNAPPTREEADALPPETVAQSGTAATNQAVPPAEDDADPDLRLQQDHAAGPEGPGQGPQ